MTIMAFEVCRRGRDSRWIVRLGDARYHFSGAARRFGEREAGIRLCRNRDAPVRRDRRAHHSTEAAGHERWRPATEPDGEQASLRRIGDQQQPVGRVEAEAVDAVHARAGCQLQER